MKSGQLVIFYDGQCPFCVGWVRFLLDRDGHDRLLFASLQSGWTRDFMESRGLPQPELDTILVWDGLALLGESEAIARLAGALPGIWQLGRHLGMLPKGMRSGVYRFIAERRHRWFGKYEQCWVPKPEDRRKFLDLEEGPKKEDKDGD